MTGGKVTNLAVSGRFDQARPLETLSLPPRLQSLLNTPIRNSDGVPVMRGSEAPTEADRREIEARIAALDASLNQRNVDRIVSVVVEMLSAFPSREITEETGKMRVRAFVVALEDVPPWAVIAGRRAWLRGEIDGCNTSFAPTPPQLRSASMKEFFKVAGQRRDLSLLLRAEVIPDRSPEDREAMAERFSALLVALAKPPGAPTE